MHEGGGVSLTRDGGDQRCTRIPAESSHVDMCRFRRFTYIIGYLIKTGKRDLAFSASGRVFDSCEHIDGVLEHDMLTTCDDEIHTVDDQSRR